MKNNLILLISLVLFSSFTFVNCQNAESKDADPPVTKSGLHNAEVPDVNLAPDFNLVGIDGSQVNLSDYKGKVVMINFWATWCPPCRKELPDIARLREELKDDGFEVIGIIAEQQHPNVLRNVQNMKSGYGLNYPMAWFNNKVINDYGPINGIPRTFIIDKQGKIAVDIEGARPYSVFKQAVMNLLHK